MVPPPRIDAVSFKILEEGFKVFITGFFLHNFTRLICDFDFIYSTYCGIMGKTWWYWGIVYHISHLFFPKVVGHVVNSYHHDFIINAIM